MKRTLIPASTLKVRKSSFHLRLDTLALLSRCFCGSLLTAKVFLMVPEDYVLGSETSRHWWTIEYGALTRSTYYYT